MIGQCPACERIAYLKLTDSEIVEGQAFQCQKCRRTVESKQSTLSEAAQ